MIVEYPGPIPRHKDEELAMLLDKLSAKTDEIWVADTIYAYYEKHWWSWKKKEVEVMTRLCKRLPGVFMYDINEYLATTKEVKAYVTGALSLIYKTDKSTMTIAHFTEPPEPHTNSYLFELINRMNLEANNVWSAKTVTEQESWRHWFREPKRITYLYRRISDHSYQVIPCVTNIGEATAFLSGALMMLHHLQKKND